MRSSGLCNLKEQEAILILNAIPGLGNARIRLLLEYFGSARAILGADASDLRSIRALPEKIGINIIHFPTEAFWEAEATRIRSGGVAIVTSLDDDYPEPLRHIPDAPVVLYKRGVWPDSWENALAVVGSRRCSQYGQSITERFAGFWAERGYPIVSGLALGIDTAAHKAALRAGGYTLAVLGSGLDCLYPAGNRDLADRIAESGALISEFPMTTPPTPYNFPRRNRIVSGLGRAVICMEAGHKSGALITCDFGLEQGKDVWAVPGHADSRYAMGSNQLIKDGAKVLTHMDDIFEEYPVDTPKRENTVTADESPSDGKERIILDLLSTDPVHRDVLQSKTVLTDGELASMLLTLELRKLIRKCPGNRFVRF